MSITNKIRIQNLSTENKRMNVCPFVVVVVDVDVVIAAVAAVAVVVAAASVVVAADAFDASFKSSIRKQFFKS